MKYKVGDRVRFKGEPQTYTVKWAGHSFVLLDGVPDHFTYPQDASYLELATPVYEYRTLGPNQDQNTLNGLGRLGFEFKCVQQDGSLIFMRRWDR